MALKTIFLDMDGVLDDFDKHADELELWREDIHKIDWKKLNAIGSKFWAEIEPFENGLYLYHKLLELCQEHGISLKILSAGPGAKCRFGKIEWLTKYCPEIPIENVIIKNKGIEKAQEASLDNGLDRNPSYSTAVVLYHILDHQRHMVAVCRLGDSCCRMGNHHKQILFQKCKIHLPRMS